MEINIKHPILFLIPAAFMSLLVACGEGSQAADTPTPEAKAVSEVEVEPSPTKEPPKPEPTKPPTPTTPSTKPSITCNLDQEQRKVSCEATGYREGAQLNWSENASSKTWRGEVFEFVLYPEETVPKVRVALEICQVSSCHTVETVIDVSHLVPETTGTEKSVQEKVEDGSSSDNSVARGHTTEKMTMQSEYSQGRCDPDGMTHLDSPPMNPAEVIYIEPMGGMHGDHITPIDHIYINYDPNESHDVYAMAAGHLVYAGHTGVDHRVIIEYSCSLYSIYIHIQELDQAIESQLEWIRPEGISKGRAYPRIPVKSGTVIGKVSGRGSFDASVVDTRETLAGFVNLESYGGEFWKLHCMDPFDYWKGSFKQDLLDKAIVVNADSPGGKIDYDVDGKLVGNWFEEGTGGYSGARTSDDPNGSKGHLAFAYNNRIKNTVWISFGTFGDTFVSASESSRGYGVRHNVPDPVDIGVGSGLVKFELIALDKGDGELTGYRVASTGELWDGKTYPDEGRLVPVYRENSVGTLLVAMLDDRTIKVEVFRKATLDKASGFTDKFKIYER